MATAPTAPFVTVEEYLKYHSEPRCEYIDGVLLPKALPDIVHSLLQNLLTLYFGSQRVQFKRLLGLTELHTRVTPTRYRIPDFAGIVQMPVDGRYPDWQTPPLFTIEIASLDEPFHMLRGKVSDHLAMGVGLVIVADPYDKTLMVATPNEPLHEISKPLIVEIPYPDGGTLTVDFDELYRQLDRELSDSR